MLRWRFETSEERKVIDMDMEKQMFGKQVSAGLSRDSGIQKGLCYALPCPHTLSLVTDAFLEQVLYLHSFRQ